MTEPSSNPRLELPTRSRGWGKTEAMIQEMARLASVTRHAAWVFDELNSVWLLMPTGVLSPAAVKPAFLGRRHGW